LYAYTGANSAGTSRIQHPPNTRVIGVTKRHSKNEVLSHPLSIRKK
jgi:coenzyme F420-reducing hydrogenase delta subunit